MITVTVTVKTIVVITSISAISGLSAQEMTDVLDHLLDRYDKNLRPNLGKGPIEIQALIELRSMGPLNEKEMTYSMQIYFRQVWYDERLRFYLPNTTELTLSQYFLTKIWRPSTFFYNGILSRQNIITVPNFFVRIRNDGRIYVSKRLSITARCPMNLVMYPMDKPACPLIVGGYGASVDEMTYKWKLGNDKSVTKGLTVLMAQFELNDIKAWNSTIKTTLGEASILTTYFYFQRYLGYYTLNMYLPCYLTVAISWVSFWINRDATPARVLLAVTTLLSITTIGITVRFGLPGVPYATALDLFFFLCFGYVFASLIEFASVHYFTRPATCKQQDTSEKEHDDELSEDEYDSVLNRPIQANYIDLDTDQRKKPSFLCIKSFWYCISGDMTYQTQAMLQQSNLTDNISNIDVLCRKLFPLSFIFINLLYWIVYLDGRIGNDIMEIKLD